MLIIIFSGGEFFGIEVLVIGEFFGVVGEFLYCFVFFRFKFFLFEGSLEDCSELVFVFRCLLFLDNMVFRLFFEVVDCRFLVVFNVFFSGDLNFIKKKYYDI